MRSVTYGRKKRLIEQQNLEEQQTKVEGHAIINPAAWPIIFNIFSGRINWSAFANVAPTLHVHLYGRKTTIH